MVQVSDKVMGARIRESRGKRSQEQIADGVGVSRAAVSQWESGDTKNLKGANLFKLAKVLGKSAEWIVTGHGPEEPGRNVPAKAGQAVWKPGQGFKGAVVESHTISVPVFDMAVIYGKAKPHPANEPVVDFMRLSKTWVQSNLAFTELTNLAVICTYGDSMGPTFSDGDILLVDTGVAEVKLDAIYMLECVGELFIKRVQRRICEGGYIMVGDSQSYRDQEIDMKRVRVLGQVIWAWNGRKL